MQLPTVEVIQELFQLARSIHILVVIKQVHVPKGVDGDQREIRLRLAQVMKGMSKLLSVGRQEVDVLWKRNNWVF